MESVILPRLLVIGGNGFIGHHVVKRGVAQGWHVTSVGLNPPSPRRFIAGANYVSANLSDLDSIRAIGTNHFDFVVNLGGYIDHTLFRDGGRKLIQTHFDGVLNLIEFIDRSTLRRLVQIGSSDEYGDSPAPQVEAVREKPISPYSLGKTATTHFLQMLHRTEELPAVTLRLFLTYGPGQSEQRFLPQIIRGCLEDREFPVSAGAQLRDYCFIDDTVEAIFSCFENNATDGHVINIGSSEPRSIRELTEIVVRLVEGGKPRFGALPYRACETMALYPDISTARELLGWSPRISLLDGLASTISWMKSCPRLA